MAVPPAVIAQVRQRANYACEYCGVSETDSAGELTVDHFQPQARGGTDDPSNLLYCCYRCNLYKADYWPVQPGDPLLWNPRQEPMQAHLLTLADGRVHPVSGTGQFTLQRLRLNRPALVAYRLRRLFQNEEAKALKQYQDLLLSLKQLTDQLAVALGEHHGLLQEARALMKHLAGGNGQGERPETPPA
jgi:hypothetical protein